jgi:hypothetical protein
MNWPDRIENYHRQIGKPYLGYAKGWCYGTWVMGNSYRKRTNYYGAFQGNFIKRVAALFPDRKRVLHLFSGKVDTAAFPGDTLDTDPRLNPTFCVSAETCDGVDLSSYDFVLADPPYSVVDAEYYYGKCMVNRNKVMATLSNGLPAGAYIAWLDQVQPMYRKASVKLEAEIGISGSTNHRVRMLFVWRRQAS